MCAGNTDCGCGCTGGDDMAGGPPMMFGDKKNEPGAAKHPAGKPGEKPSQALSLKRLAHKIQGGSSK